MRAVTKTTREPITLDNVPVHSGGGRQGTLIWLFVIGIMLSGPGAIAVSRWLSASQPPHSSRADASEGAARGRLPLPESGWGVVTSGDAGAQLAGVPAASVPGASMYSDPLLLVPGQAQIDGVSVGYPRTETGAVSAAVEFWTRLGSTLDRVRAAEVGALIADPTCRCAARGVVDEEVSGRHQLALSADPAGKASGRAGTSSSTRLDIRAFQMRQRGSSGRFLVLLLAERSMTGLPVERAKIDRDTVVLPAYLHWVTLSPRNRIPACMRCSTVRFEGLPTARLSLRGIVTDWRMENLRSHHRKNYARLEAVPGSAKAALLGWRALQR